MRKNILLGMLFLLLICFTFIPSIVGADSGFDSSSSSSSSSDGSSFSSSDGSGGEIETKGELFLIYVVEFSMFGICCIIAYNITKMKKYDKLISMLVIIGVVILKIISIILMRICIDDIEIESTILSCEFAISFFAIYIGVALLGYFSFGLIKDVDNEVFVSYGFDKKWLKRELYDRFVDVQYAWMNFDYDKLKEFCTDELYNSYKSQLEALKLKNRQNIMGGFELRKAYISEIEEDENYIIIKTYMQISFFDYIIDTISNNVVKGSKNNKITINYLMTFFQGKNESDIVVCPNCGKETHVNTRSECEYCHSLIVKNSNRFVLSKKENINR